MDRFIEQIEQRTNIRQRAFDENLPISVVLQLMQRALDMRNPEFQSAFGLSDEPTLPEIERLAACFGFEIAFVKPSDDIQT